MDSQFTKELSSFHDAVSSRKKQNKRLHVHLFETLVGKVHKVEKKRKDRAEKARASTTGPATNGAARGEEAGDMEIDAASTIEDKELSVREALVSSVVSISKRC